MSLWVAWLNALVPLLAVLGAYVIALAQGYNNQCIPFIEGCTSISRAARFGDALFWFRGLMLPLSALLVIFWLYQQRWLQKYADTSKSYQAIFVLGVIASLALALYANFLGSDGTVYRFMRQSGVFLYFGCAMLAQLLSLYSVRQYREQFSRNVQRLLTAQWLSVLAQWMLGLVSLSIMFVAPELKYKINNILEWNYALLMTLFYLFSALIWKARAPNPV